jgi:hypothetical protein
MTLRFHIDPETDLPHIYRHGVREDEVFEVLDAPGSVIHSRRQTQTVVGQTRAGRYLKVVCVPDEEGDGVFVITAYTLRRKGVVAFRRRRRWQ